MSAGNQPAGYAAARLDAAWAKVQVWPRIKFMKSDATTVEEYLKDLTR